MDLYFGVRAQRYYEQAPLTLVDVGARGGLQPNWKPAARHLRVVGFEPDAVEHARLARDADPQRAVYINAAAWNAPATLTLNVTRDGGTSSLHQPNVEFLGRFPRVERFDVVKRVGIAADRLDTLLPRNGVTDTDFIKIDTQGAELPILQGATGTLADDVFGVEVEVQFAPLYVGQSAYGDVDTLLRDHGFQLFDLRHSYWKRAAGARFGGPKGQLVFADALYFKTEEAFAQQLARLEDDDARRVKLLHALTIALLYGYADYAIELFEAHRALLDAALAADIHRELTSEIDFALRLPHFRGRGWLSQLFYRVHRVLYPTFEGWASGGRRIGNIE